MKQHSKIDDLGATEHHPAITGKTTPGQQTDNRTPSPDNRSEVVKLTEALVRDYVLPDGVDRVWLRDAALPGFGVIVGRRSRSYVVRASVKGAGKKLVTIGQHGAPGAGEDRSQVWTEKRARAEAMRLLGSMSAGIEPQGPTNGAAGPKPEASGPTLRDALEFHIGRMQRGENRRGKVCSPRSIYKMRGEITKHFGDWLDKPIAALDADAIEKVLKKIEKETPRRSDANPNNPPGRALANGLLVQLGTVWRSYDKRYGLPGKCPTDRLQRGALQPRKTRIPNSGFAAWYARVMAMPNQIRRDLQLVALFTGVRSEGLRTLTWQEVDFDDELIQIERAKGDKPYTIPMVLTVRQILEGRRADNAIQFSNMGGDHGYVFPSVTRDRPFRVIPVAEPKERENVVDDQGNPVRDEDGNVLRRKPKELQGIHASRRTFNSVAIEIGIPLEAREALMNHAGRGVNVRSYGAPQNWDYLRECAAKVEAALWDRIKGKNRTALPRAQVLNG